MTKTNVVNLDPETEYATARADVQRAKTDRDAARRHADALAAQLFALAEKQKDGAATDAHALAYLAGRPAPEGPATIRAQLEDAKSRVAVLERAVSLAGERVTAARKKLDTREIDAARPRHAEAVRRIADALVSLSLALEEEHRIRAALPHVLALAPMTFNGVGFVGDISSDVSMWLKRALGLGFVEKDFRAADIGPRRAAVLAAGKARAARMRQPEPEPRAKPADAKAKIAHASKRVAKYAAAAE